MYNLLYEVCKCKICLLFKCIKKMHETDTRIMKIIKLSIFHSHTSCHRDYLKTSGKVRILLHTNTSTRASCIWPSSLVLSDLTQSQPSPISFNTMNTSPFSKLSSSVSGILEKDKTATTFLLSSTGWKDPNKNIQTDCLNLLLMIKYHNIMYRT